MTGTRGAKPLGAAVTAGSALAVTAALVVSGCGGGGGSPDGAPGRPVSAAVSAPVSTPSVDRPSVDRPSVDRGTPAASTTPAGAGPRAAPTARRSATARRSSTAPPVAAGPTDLAVSTDGLTLGRPVDGVRHATLTVRIRNKGPAGVNDLYLVIEVPESMSGTGAGWAGCTRLASVQAEFPAWSRCHKGALAPGATVTLTFGMSSPAAADGTDSLVSRWQVYAHSYDPAGEPYRELDWSDNRKIFMVTRA